MEYRVQFERDDNGTILVTCPDLPEVATFGDDEVDALFHAADAIETALQGRIRARQIIPDPHATEGAPVELSPLVEAKIAFYRAFLESGLTKAELGRRLDWFPPSVDRLFDLSHDSRIGQIGTAIKQLDRHLHFKVEA